MDETVAERKKDSLLLLVTLTRRNAEPAPSYYIDGLVLTPLERRLVHEIIRQLVQSYHVGSFD